MIATTTFSLIFLIVIITKTSFVDLAGVKKVLVKPMYDVPAPAENQNAVPVSYK